MGRKKLHKISYVAPFFAGAFLFFSALFAPAPRGGGENLPSVVTAQAYAGDRVPRGVKVNGVLVGGMNVKKAEKLLRRLLAERVPTLTVKTPKGEYVFSYPEIGFSDDIEPLLAAAEKNGEYSAQANYTLNAAPMQAEYICANNAVKALDAEARFSSEGFEYEKERAGIACDKKRLLKDLEASIAAGAKQGEDGRLHFRTVTLSTKPTYPKIKETAVKLGTKRIASFTTYFNADDKGRSENIALAASRIDGLTIRPNEEFSFNAMVGARTKENGFKEAKIIQDGEFIVGTGGGVCQASTTLYNAAVLAGLKITARRPHSLAVHYVDPSRDAMVSSYSDFKFKNTHSYPVYLAAKVKGDGITVTFYGKDEGYRYEIVSKVTGDVPPPDPIEKTGDFDGVLREGKPGIKSEAYLETYLYGKLVKREKLRADTYAPIRGIVSKKANKKSPA